MTKFKVKLCEMVVYWVTVDAEDADEAGEKAVEIWGESEDPTQDFNGQGLGVDVEEIRKTGE